MENTKTFIKGGLAGLAIWCIITLFDAIDEYLIDTESLLAWIDNVYCNTNWNGIIIHRILLKKEASTSGNIDVVFRFFINWNCIRIYYM